MTFHYFHEADRTFLAAEEKASNPTTMREHFEKYIDGVAERQPVVTLGDSPVMVVYGD